MKVSHYSQNKKTTSLFVRIGGHLIHNPLELQQASRIVTEPQCLKNIFRKWVRTKVLI